MLFDTHAHINFPDYASDTVPMLERAGQAGVARMLCIGMMPEGGREALALARRFPGRVYASVGCHPYDAAKLDDAVLAEFEALLAEPETVLVGEMGVDTVKAPDPVALQQRAFARQLELAKRLDKPVCVHSREAFKLCEEVIREVCPKGHRGFAHCFSDGPEEALAWRRMGFYISFAGQVTFKNAENLRRAARAIRPEDCVIETDCPFLAPVPFRGKRNEPAFVRHTAAFLADLWGIGLAELGEITTANARRVLGV